MAMPFAVVLSAALRVHPIGSKLPSCAAAQLVGLGQTQDCSCMLEWIPEEGTLYCDSELLHYTSIKDNTALQ